MAEIIVRLSYGQILRSKGRLSYKFKKFENLGEELQSYQIQGMTDCTETKAQCT